MMSPDQFKTWFAARIGLPIHNSGPRALLHSLMEAVHAKDPLVDLDVALESLVRSSTPVGYVTWYAVNDGEDCDQFVEWSVEEGALPVDGITVLVHACADREDPPPHYSHELIECI